LAGAGATGANYSLLLLAGNGRFPAPRAAAHGAARGHGAAGHVRARPEYNPPWVDDRFCPLSVGGILGHRGTGLPLIDHGLMYSEPYYRPQFSFRFKQRTHEVGLLVKIIFHQKK
jgi:hypothetical protein